jgi:hypothetical protein
MFPVCVGSQSFLVSGAVVEGQPGGERFLSALLHALEAGLRSRPDHGVQSRGRTLRRARNVELTALTAAAVPAGRRRAPHRPAAAPRRARTAATRHRAPRGPHRDPGRGRRRGPGPGDGRGDGTTTTTVTQATSATRETSSTAGSLNASALYANTAAGVVDITSRGIASSSSRGGSPFGGPSQSSTATGTGFVVDGKATSSRRRTWCRAPRRSA